MGGTAEVEEDGEEGVADSAAKEGKREKMCKPTNLNK